MNADITLCTNCHCMTKSVRKARAYFVCDSCGHNKTLGDVFQYEKNENQRGKNDGRIL